MNISFFCSDEYFTGAKIMLTSLLCNNNFEKHNIFLISHNIKKNKVLKLNRFLKKRFGQEVMLIRITEEMRKGFHVSGHFSLAGFHKLYVFNYLPKKLDKIMCLDADMIVLKSLKGFYYQDMGENIFIACQDAHIHEDKEHLEEIGFGQNEPYYNLGCIVIDLKKFLSMYTVNDYVEWVNKNKKIAKYVAQDVVNVMFKGKIKEMPGEIYNNQIFDNEEKEDEELRKIEDNCCIIHSVGYIKHWNFRYDISLKKYVYDTMKKNGMKREYALIMLEKKLFNLKYKVLGIVKGA